MRSMARTNKNGNDASDRGKQPRARARTLPRISLASGEPLYRQLVQSLRNEILRGALPIGSQLPSEEELTERFAVSRHTVREALRQLRADGLVSSRQGSGTTVMAPPPSTTFNVHRVASIDELIAYAVESRYLVERTDMLGSEEAPPHLELPAQQRWLRLQGFRFKDERDAQPICWTEVFVSADYAGVERLISRQRGPIWQSIEDMYGERITEVEQTLRVRCVPPQVAKGLQVEPDSTVVEVCRTYKTTAGKVAEAALNLYPADKFRFTMKLRRA